MPRKGNQKRVAAGKKGRDLQLKRLKMEVAVVAIADEDVEMADEEQPAAAEEAAEKAVAEEEQPACGLLSLPWNFWDVAVILQHRPLLQTRLLGLAGMTCKFFREHLDTVHQPNSFGRLVSTRVRCV